MRASHSLLHNQRHRAMIVQARMRANENFSDASLAMLHSVSMKFVMSPRGAVDLKSPLVTLNCL